LKASSPPSKKAKVEEKRLLVFSFFLFAFYLENAVANASRQAGLDEPVIRRMHQNYTALRTDQTVAAALDWLRQHPPQERIDNGGKMEGSG
jgi:hypothetical protein